MSTVQAKLHTNKKLSNGTFSVKLYIYDDITENVFWYPLGYSSTRQQWNNDPNQFRKNYPNYKKKNLLIKQKERQVVEFILDFTLRGERFDYEEFKRRMTTIIYSLKHKMKIEFKDRFYQCEQTVVETKYEATVVHNRGPV